MTSLRTNMHQYYTQADGVPQYIIMLENAQKKAKSAGMPITNICTWTGAWKIAFRLAISNVSVKS